MREYVCVPLYMCMKLVPLNNFLCALILKCFTNGAGRARWCHLELVNNLLRLTCKRAAAAEKCQVTSYSGNSRISGSQQPQALQPQAT